MRRRGDLPAIVLSCAKDPDPSSQSAALGLAISGAVGLGYSNIFVTAPSPENLNTLFQFVFKVCGGGVEARGVCRRLVCTED